MQRVPDTSRASHEVLLSLLTERPPVQLINTLLTQEKTSRLLSTEKPLPSFWLYRLPVYWSEKLERREKGTIVNTMPISNQERKPDRLNWLTEIYRAYAAALQRFIANKIGDPTLAEDLTSTVFLKALRWLREDESPKSVRSWLYATARKT